MHDYLKQDAHVTCISCVDCIKDKNKMVQYRYNPALKSSYADTYTKADAVRQQIWNLDVEKRQLKVPY